MPIIAVVLLLTTAKGTGQSGPRSRLLVLGLAVDGASVLLVAGVPRPVRAVPREHGSACCWQLAREHTAVKAVICLVIGAKLIGDAIIGLAR